MNGTVTVRPIGNVLDIWDEISRRFDPDEEENDNRKGDDAGKAADNDEAISLEEEEEEEEGVKASIGKGEGMPTKQEVAAHMVNHIPFRSWRSHCVKGRRMAIRIEGRQWTRNQGSQSCRLTARLCTTIREKVRRKG